MFKIDNMIFPDTCPKTCPQKDEGFTYQGCLCSRCPVFSCVPPKNDPLGYGAMLKPEEYNKEWAKEFHTFISGGERPTLKLYCKK